MFSSACDDNVTDQTKVRGNEHMNSTIIFPSVFQSEELGHDFSLPNKVHGLRLTNPPTEVST